MAKHYDSIVTFNGRGFDVPFIYLRSALLNVPISKKNWLGYRLRHRAALRPGGAIDLLQRERARRRGAAVQPGFLLQGLRHRIAQEPGVTGMDVTTLMAEKKFREIAEYCLRDVRATVELYKIWKERLAGIK